MSDKKLVTCTCGLRFYPRNMEVKQRRERKYVTCPNCRKVYWLETILFRRKKY